MFKRQDGLSYFLTFNYFKFLFFVILIKKPNTVIYFSSDAVYPVFPLREILNIMKQCFFFPLFYFPFLFSYSGIGLNSTKCL